MIIPRIQLSMCEIEAMEVDDEMHEFMDVKKALKDLHDEQKLKILVCGKTGTGKSSLLNTLIGRELCKVGGPGEIDHFAFTAVTQKVTPLYASIQNTLLEIFDSPGLQDGTENDEDYLEDMHKKCENINLVLYCVDMTTTRWTYQEVKATNLLTKKFGAEFWKKAVLVLTKANMVKPASTGIDEKKFCKTAYDNFVNMFQTQLMQQNIPEQIASNILTIAAGSYSDRYLPYVSKAVSDNSEQKCKNFLPELWLTCFERISDNSRFNFLKVIDYSKRIEASRDHLQPEQKEFLEKIEQKFEAKEKELQEKEKRLNKRIEQLNIEHQRKLEEMRRNIQRQYAQPPPRPVIHRTVHYTSSSSDDCCIL